MSAVEESPRTEIVPSLDERADRIFEILEHAAFDIGAELIEAKREHPREFMEWVQRSLPFGIDKAERLMAISRAFAAADDFTKRALPAPWTALFELSRVPIDAIHSGIAEGEVHPDMTTREAIRYRKSLDDAREMVFGHRDAPETEERTERPGPKPGFDPNPVLAADVLARELVRQPRTDLASDVEALLREWLGDPTE
jgi:hypothetical protein